MAATFATLPPVLQPKEEDIQMMLSAGVHTGTRNSDTGMNDYIWRRRNDGVHILNIGKTWEKIILAARIIVAIENPEDVIAISARPYGVRYGHEFFVVDEAFVFGLNLCPVLVLLLFVSMHCTRCERFLNIQTILEQLLLLVDTLLVLLPIRLRNNSKNHGC
jgi:hypothetical protein